MSSLKGTKGGFTINPSVGVSVGADAAISVNISIPDTVNKIRETVEQIVDKIESCDRGTSDC